MSNLLLMMACLVAGIALRRAPRMPDNAHLGLNGVLVHVALPALTLRYLHDFHLESGSVLPVAMPWLLFGLGAAVFLAVGRALRLPRATIGALTLVGGFGNTSFVGLPMIESLYGTAGLPLGVLIDQMGSYLALSTLGILAAQTFAAHERTTLWRIARKVMSFPPFVAMVLALALHSVLFPAVVSAVLARLSDTVAPLALLSVGMQLRVGALSSHAKALCVGLGYKLVLCPALAITLLWITHAAVDMSGHVTVIESAMPPMMGAAIVAIESKLDPGLVSLMIGLGIPLAFVSVPAWNWLYSFSAV